jgi:hypothetical protein
MHAVADAGGGKQGTEYCCDLQHADLSVDAALGGDDRRGVAKDCFGFHFHGSFFHSKVCWSWAISVAGTHIQKQPVMIQQGDKQAGEDPAADVATSRRERGRPPRQLKTIS